MWLLLQKICYKINVLKNTNKKYLLYNYIEKQIDCKLKVYISTVITADSYFYKMQAIKLNVLVRKKLFYNYIKRTISIDIKLKVYISIFNTTYGNYYKIQAIK